MPTAGKHRPYFKRLFRHLRALNTPQRLAVCRFMSGLVNGEGIYALIDQIARARTTCPACGADAINRHGFANGLQRYRCRICKRSFNGLTGTPLARLRLKQRWLAYFNCLRDPACTVQSAADRVAVAASTSFRWRHRFLKWVKFDRPDPLQGIAEVEATYLLESQKGTPLVHGVARKRGCESTAAPICKQYVAVVVARDRSGKTIDFVAGHGELRAQALCAGLLPRLAPDIQLVSDGHAAYKRFARQARIEHRIVRRRAIAEGPRPLHLRNVSGYLSRFHEWLRHFNGVATHHLPNYLGWRWAIDMLRIDSAEKFLRAALGHFNS